MNKEPSGTRRYLAVYLPLLPAERLIRQHLRQHGKAPDGPFVLVEKQRGALILTACDKEALGLGLAPGLPLADARARVPGLAVFEHDADADRALLEWLADGCERYTPLVALDPPDGLILDIGGCEHIWDGEAGLAGDLSQRLTKAGFTFVIVAAETPDKARGLVRYGTDAVLDSGDVRKLPVRALELDDSGMVALKRAGLHTLGDLASRPRIALAARLGMAAVIRLDRLMGKEDIRISPRRHAPELFAIQRFAEPVAYSEAILAALEGLVVQSGLALCERAEGGRHFAATLYRSDGDVRRLAVETGAPTRDAVLLSRLFRERIDALADPLDPGFGYDAIRLDVIRTDPLTATQKQAFDAKEKVEEEFKSLIDRLSTRLGADHVLRFIAGNSHIPEMASAYIPAQQAENAFPWLKTEADEPPIRPFTLFDPPHPVEVMVTDLPDGPPAAFRWRRTLHRVTYAEGPERIAAQWWRCRRGYLQGNSNPDRDYFRIEDDRGRRFWLFRSGLYGEMPSPVWCLHGAFA